ncbi:MAG: hypothetical protein AAB601_00420 [Patescibacteria group bacterium]
MKDRIPGLAPVLPAFHPYFSCGNANTVEVVVGGKTFRGFAKESRTVPLDGEKNVFIRMPGRVIEMELLGAFSGGSYNSQIVLWSDSPNEYVCVEPILEEKRLFDTARGRHLDEGERMEELAVRFKVLK